MKNVFLSLAMIAALTVVSCKQAEEKTEEMAIDTMAVEAVEATVDTMAVEAAPAEATEAPAETK
jgi:hypothetical protein